MPDFPHSAVPFGTWKEPPGTVPITPEPDPDWIMCQCTPEQKATETAVSVSGADVVSNGLVVNYVEGTTEGHKQTVRDALGGMPDSVWGVIDAEHIVWPTAKSAGQMQTAKATAEASPYVASVDYNHVAPDVLAFAKAPPRPKPKPKVPNDAHAANNRRRHRKPPPGISQTLKDWNQQTNLLYMNVPEAWPFSQGAGIRVAMIGTGYSQQSYEVWPQVVAEWDFLRNDARADDDVRPHENGTGSVVAAVTNNGKGMAGIAPQAKLLMAKVVDLDGTITLANMLNALNWSVANGATVLNMSLIFNPNADSLNSWFVAHQSTVVSVASAGNTANRQTAMYPASYPGVIAVSGTTIDTMNFWYGNIPSAPYPGPGSTWGPYVDFSAPGEWVVSAYGKPNDHYYVGYSWGTSFSAPHVAGVAALILSRHPTWTPTQVYNAMKAGAMQRDGATGTWNEFFGWGIPNAYLALVSDLVDTPPTTSGTHTYTFPLAAGQNDDLVSRAGASYPPTGAITRMPDYISVEPTRTRDSAGAYVIRNGLLQWNTSGIPDNATINSASIDAYVLGMSSADARNLVIESSAWSGATTDYAQDAPAGGASIVYNGPLSALSWGVIRTFSLSNPTIAISKSGYSDFRLHVSGGLPTGYNWIALASSEDTHQEPRLTVTYTVP